MALSEITWRRVVREVVREELGQLGELAKAIATCPVELQRCRSDLDRCRSDLDRLMERIRDVVPVATPPMPFVTVEVAPAEVQAETGISVSVSVETRVE